MKLSEKVFEFECEISGEDFALEVKNEIDKLKHLEDVNVENVYDEEIGYRRRLVIDGGMF